MIRFFVCGLLALFLLHRPFAVSQTAAATGCDITLPPPPDPKLDMFTPAQEVELGNVIDDSLQSLYDIDEPELSAYLQSLGDGLIKHLPPSNLKFRFFLSDAPEANAWSISGGRVYVTRKLIAMVRSEDELAGVLAHETGHVITHQSAIDFTRFFRAIGITQVVDRKDIEDDFHRLLESNKSFTTSGESHQLEADRVGLEVLTLSGYKVDAMAEFYDRFTNNKGRIGNWFTDFFSGAGPDTKRYREMEHTVRHFAPACVSSAKLSDANFKQWQNRVVTYSGTGRRESISGVVLKKVLDPPLQDEIHTLRFSFDGKYLIAQDEASIYVLTRDPLAFKFRIDAPEAYPAQFTLDSKFLTFYTPRLHIEVWDVDTGLRTQVNELFNLYGCAQTTLSPDGRTLACIDAKETFTLFDTATGNRIVERKQIREGSFDISEGLASTIMSYSVAFANMGFSPDSRYFVLADKANTFAVQIPSGQEFPLKGNLRSLVQGAFSFLPDGSIIANQKNGAQAFVLSFPDGKIERQVELGAAAPFRVAKGDYVLLRPIKDYAVGVLDLRSNQIVRASKTPAIDIYDDVAANVLGTGEVALFGKSSTPLAKLFLPRGHFGALRASDISADSGYLAASTRDLGAIWNITDGTRSYGLKGFRGACFQGTTAVYVYFPKRDKIDAAVVRVGLQHNGMAVVQKIDASQTWEDCPYLVNLKRHDSKSNPSSDDEARDYRYEGRKISERDVYERTRENESLEVEDVFTGKVLWSRKFDKAVPRIWTDGPSGVVICRWRLDENGARSELKNVTLTGQQSGFSDDDDLFEILDISTGKLIHALVIPTNHRAFGFGSMMGNLNWLIVHDNSHDRTLTYSLKTGQRTGRVFGRPLCVLSSGVVAVAHGLGTIGLYDANDMHQISKLAFSYSVAGVSLTHDGSKLVVLTTDEVLNVIDPSRVSDATLASTK